MYRMQLEGSSKRCTLFAAMYSGALAMHVSKIQFIEVTFHICCALGFIVHYFICLMIKYHAWFAIFLSIKLGDFFFLCFQQYNLIVASKMFLIFGFLNLNIFKGFSGKKPPPSQIGNGTTLRKSSEILESIISNWTRASSRSSIEMKGCLEKKTISAGWVLMYVVGAEFVLCSV